MKIAVIFLCVAIASFLDTSTGFSQAKSFDQNKVDYYVRSSQELGLQLESMKTCPEHEKKTRQKCALEHMIFNLKMLAIDIDCPFEILLEKLEMPLEMTNLILSENLDGVLSIISVDKFAKKCICMVEVTLAHVQVLLKRELLKLCSLTGSVNGLFSCFSILHDTLGSTLKDNPLQGLLGVASPLLSSLTGKNSLFG
ncbi:uncharacterized protein ACNLHF_016172 isoform 1-T1 [Anomaloglossus baeobatrachus]